MSYELPVPREWISMDKIVANMAIKPSKKVGLKWEKMHIAWVIKRRKFEIFSQRQGQGTVYKLGYSDSTGAWDKIAIPERATFLVADTEKFIYFQMCIDGMPRTNVFKQPKS